MQSRVLPISQKLTQSFPSLYLSFHINDNDNKIPLLKKSEADFIFLPRDQVPLELDSKLLKKSTYVLVGGATYKKEKNDLKLIDFSLYDTFTSSFFERFKINFSKGKERHYINNTLMLPSLLEQNIGVAVLDIEHFKSAKKSYKIYNIFPDKSYEIEWALVWLPRPELPPYFKKVIELIQ